MKDELLFHFVSRKIWKESLKEGTYQPRIYSDKGYIPCTDGKHVEEVANKKFGNSDDLLMLVIDPTRVNGSIIFGADENQSESIPRIDTPLNTDAVIDKIELSPDQEGKFEIKVEGN